MSDILEFKPTSSYGIWHDRATFHFLKSNKEIEVYQSLVEKFVNNSIIIGTFSKNGPLKCSGLEVCQYDEGELLEVFKDGFKKVDCLSVDHTTPFETIQNFQFCRMKKLS